MRPRAFSIIEVLFAVMILGIGFILVAAMFPVAIQQTQANVDEVEARSVADAGVNHVATILRSVPVSEQTKLATTYLTGFEYRRANQLPTATDPVPAATPPVGAIYVRNLVTAGTVVREDPRYAWTIFYRCNPSAVAGKPLDLVAVALKATTTRECSIYTGGSDVDLIIPPPGTDWHALYDNATYPCTIDIRNVPGAPAEIDFKGDAQAEQAAVTGALLLVRSGARLGQIFTLGAYNEATNRWQVAGGSPAVAADALDQRVMLVGRSLRDPSRAWDPDPANVTTFNPREGSCPVIGYRVIHTTLP